jgi:hypothetical protein
MDPGIAAGFSNLTAALLGSADDDAAMARARASDASAANSYAAAEANRELARSRGVSADRMKELAGIAGENNPALMSRIAQGMGLSAKVDPFGNLVKPQVLGPKRSVPAYPGADGVGTDMGVGNLANAFFGDLSYNPQQFTAGLNNLNEGADSTLARSILMDPSSSLAEQAGAFKSLGNSPGANFDETLARDNMVLDSEDFRYDSRRDLEAAEYAADQQRRGVFDRTKFQFGKGGQGDRDTASQEKWENYSADQIKSAQIEIATMDDATKIQIAKDKLAAETKRLESTDIDKQYIAVNGNLVMSEALATKLGVTTKVKVDGQEVYAFRTPSPTEEGVTIYLGEGENAKTITVTAASLDQIAPKLINGRLTITKDHPWKVGSTAAPNSRTSFSGDNLNEQQTKDLSAKANAQIAAGLGDLSVATQLGLTNYILQEFDSGLAVEGATILSLENTILSPIVSGGTINPDISGLNGISVPTYFHNRWTAQAAQFSTTPSFTEDQFKQAVVTQAMALGYTQAEAKKLATAYNY